MTTFTEAQALALQVSQDALMFHALAPGYTPQLPQAIQWGGLDYAEYAVTVDSANMGQYLPSPTSNGNADAFISGVFNNALGRSPTASDISFYEHVVASAPNAFQGFAEVVMFVGLSAESQAHNHGLSLVVT